MSIIDIILINVKDIELCVKVMPVSKDLLNTAKDILKIIEFKNSDFGEYIEDQLCDCVASKYDSINPDSNTSKILKCKKVEPFNMCEYCSKKVDTLSATSAMKKYKLKKDDLEKFLSYKEPAFQNLTKRYFYEPDLYKYAILKHGMSSLYYILNPDKKISIAKQKRLDKIKNLDYKEDSFEYNNIIYEYIHKPSKCDYRNMIRRLENYQKFMNIFNTLTNDQKHILKNAKYYYVSSNYALTASQQTDEDIRNIFKYCFEYSTILELFIAKRLQYYIPMQYSNVNMFFTRDITIEEAKNNLKIHFQQMNIQIPFEL
jgi:hypothetical protein